MEDSVISLVTDRAVDTINHLIVHQDFREGLKYNFSVCMGVAWHGRFVSPQWFVEWVESNILFGAEWIILHNMSMTSDMDPYARPYVERGILQILPWDFDPIIKLAGTKSNLQLTMTFDCFYRMRRRTVYMAQFDQDELIVPRHPDDVTWSDMIKRSGCEPGACVYGARQVFFGRQYSNNLRNANKTGLLTMDATQRGLNVFRDGCRSKYIADVNKIILPHTHHVACAPSHPRCTLPEEVGGNHHYRWPGMKYLNEHLGTIQDNSTLKYQDKLTRAVTRTMQTANSSFVSLTGH